ncbi:MAG: hypothetical protein HUU38_14590 [Anaerolineales bacterium]|nr:hypothetical protein [Anaerolineales bacterium]
MPTSTLFFQSLPYSALYTLILGISFLLLARLNPEIWLNDYPPDIKARYGAISAAANRQRKIFGTPVILFMLGFPFFVLAHLAQTASLTFGQVFVILLTMFTSFNLFDLLVMDWLIFNTLQPRLFVLPGTEGMAGYKDYAFHFWGSVKGQIGLTLVSLLGAGVAMLFR